MKKLVGNRFLYENNNSQDAFERFVEANRGNLEMQFQKSEHTDFWVFSRAVYTGNIERDGWEKSVH